MARKRITDRVVVVCLGLLLATTVHAEDSNFVKFFYRVGVWLDNYSLRNLDTSYITLPDYSWRIALTNSEVGIFSDYAAQTNSEIGRVQLVSTTTPSVDLGFHIGLRTIGFGYSWDVLHAYASKLNFGFGGKQWGVELNRQTSSNIKSSIAFPDYNISPIPITEGDVWVTNTNLSAWFALNAYHYSHNAAIKQTYIQKRTAGSLLLNLSYLNTDVSFGHNPEMEGALPIVFNNVYKIVTHQVAVGLGYGINYTPNHGKVLIHASATAQAVFYSVNYVSYEPPDSLKGFAYPSYEIRPTSPIHFTGTMRLAVSWEINKWVHLNARVQGDNIRFKANANSGMVSMSNWNWQTSLAVGVRLGVGQERKRSALGLIEPAPQPERPAADDEQASEKKSFVLPQWLTDYFFSPIP